MACAIRRAFHTGTRPVVVAAQSWGGGSAARGRRPGSRGRRRWTCPAPTRGRRCRTRRPGVHRAPAMASSPSDPSAVAASWSMDSAGCDHRPLDGELELADLGLVRTIWWWAWRAASTWSGESGDSPVSEWCWLLAHGSSQALATDSEVLRTLCLPGMWTLSRNSSEEFSGCLRVVVSRLGAGAPRTSTTGVRGRKAGRRPSTPCPAVPVLSACRRPTRADPQAAVIALPTLRGFRGSALARLAPQPPGRRPAPAPQPPGRPAEPRLALDPRRAVPVLSACRRPTRATRRPRHRPAKLPGVSDRRVARLLNHRARRPPSHPQPPGRRMGP